MSRHNDALWNLELEFISRWVEAKRPLEYTRHAKQRMTDRGVSEEMIHLALLYGKIAEGYDINHYPRSEKPFQNTNPVRTINLFLRGHTLVVAIALSKRSGRLFFSVVTVYWK